MLEKLSEKVLLNFYKKIANEVLDILRGAGLEKTAGMFTNG